MIEIPKKVDKVHFGMLLDCQKIVKLHKKVVLAYFFME